MNKKETLTKARLLKILDNIIAWGNELDYDTRESILYAMDLTKEETAELGLDDYLDEQDDDDDDEEEEDYE